MNFVYNEIFNFVYEKLRSAYGWTIQILAESVYSNLISAFSYGVEQLAFYDEILTKESTFKTAELTSSINYISWMLNYTPHRKKGAISMAYISPDPAFNLRSGNGDPFEYTDFSTTIAKWSPIIGTTLNAYALEDVAIPSGVRLFHYNLPVRLTGNSSTIDLVNDYGVALIPVTVPFGDLSTYINTPSTANLTDPSRKITVGSYVNIKGSAFFSGEYQVVPIPSDVSGKSPANYIAIQTNYFANANFSEIIQLGTVLSVGQIRLQIKEGIPQEYIYTATGAINEKIPIFSPNIDNDTYEVFLVNITEETLNGVSFFTTTITDTVTVLTEDAYLVNDLSKYYCTVYNDADFQYIYFEFGDNIKTKKLVAGQQVLIKYAETQGELGNTPTLDIINSFGVNLLSSNGIPVTGLYVTNVSAFTGGSDYETPESIKFNSRAKFNESNLLISNWTPIVNKYPSILKSRVWTEIDVNPLIIDRTLQNNVYISAIDKSGTQILSGSIEANNITYIYLRKYSSPTDVINFKDTNIIQVKATIYYKINPTNLALFFNKTIQSLKDKYDIFNVDYAVSLYASNVVRTIEDSSSDIIYSRVDLSYLESSITNRYLTNDNQNIYLTATFRNNDVKKDSYIYVGSDSTTLSVYKLLTIWIRRKINGTYGNWILIGKQVSGTNIVQFVDTATGLPDYNNNRTKTIIDTQLNQAEALIDVGDILVYTETVQNSERFKKATSADEANYDRFYYFESYNSGTGECVIVEAGEIDITGLVSMDSELPSFDLKDENGNLLEDNKVYFLNSSGKLTLNRGTGIRKFMIKKKPSEAIIVKGFYFDDALIANQSLYSSIPVDQEIKFYNYIQGFQIETIKNQTVPNSNQRSYNEISNTYVSDVSYTNQFNISLITTVNEQDVLNPSVSQLRGYELRILYNTVEREDNISSLYYNDIRLPYFTNILDVQTENIDFIED